MTKNRSRNSQPQRYYAPQPATGPAFGWGQLASSASAPGPAFDPVDLGMIVSAQASRAPSPAMSFERHSDRSWVEDVPAKSPPRAASPAELPPCSPAPASIRYVSRARTPCTPPLSDEGLYLYDLPPVDAMPEEVERKPEEDPPETTPASPVKGPHIEILPYVHAEAIPAILSREQTVFRHYRSLKAALDIMPSIDRSRLEAILPEIVVLNLGANSEQVVDALTGVKLRVRGASLNPLIWEVTLRAQESKSLWHIEEAFPPPDAADPIRLATHPNESADLIVYQLAGASQLDSVKNVLQRQSCAIVIAQNSTLRMLGPDFIGGFDLSGLRTIFLDPKTFDEPGKWKTELSQKLDGILSGILRDKISETMTCLRSRIDEVRAELSALPVPAEHSDAEAKLMDLAAEFAADIYGVSSKRNGATSFTESIRSEYVALSQEIKSTIPRFTVRPITHGFEDWGLFGQALGSLAPVEIPLPPRAASPPGRAYPCHSPSPSQCTPRSWGSRAPSMVPASRPPRSPPPRSPSPEVPPSPASRSLPRKPLQDASYITLETVSSRLQLFRSGELPGHFPLEKVSKTLIAEATERWADIADRRLESIIQLLAGRLSTRVEEIYGKYAHSGIQAEIMDVIKKRIRSAHRAARDAISILTNMESNAIVGDEELFLAAKERWNEQFARGRSLPLSPARVDRLRQTAALDVMATVAAYFEIAQQRFVDGVERAIESHVIRPLGKDIAPEILKALKHKDAKMWLEIPAKEATKRVELADRLEALRRAREEVMLCALA